MVFAPGGKEITMNLQNNRVLFWAVLCFIAVTVTGCGFARSPEDTTRQFMDALKRADEPGVRALMTQTARQRMDKPLNMTRKDSMQYTLGAPVVHDTFAQVPVAVHDGGKDGSITVKMKQDEGEWRVYAIGFALAPGTSEITFDMEHPDAIYGDLFRGLGEGMGAMFKGMGEGMGAMLKGLGEGLQKLQEAPRRP
jgi:hypothetical protein